MLLGMAFVKDFQGFVLVVASILLLAYRGRVSGPAPMEVLSTCSLRLRP